MTEPTLSRRYFLTAAATSAGGLAIGVMLPDWSEAAIDASPADRPTP